MLLLVQRGQLYKGLLYWLMAVYVTIGLGRGIFLEHQQRRQCIEDYGWLRGWQLGSMAHSGLLFILTMF